MLEFIYSLLDYFHKRWKLFSWLILGGEEMQIPDYPGVASNFQSLRI
jgi:hypothetical protein